MKPTSLLHFIASRFLSGALAVALPALAHAGRSEHFDVRTEAAADSAAARSGRRAEIQAAMSVAREKLAARVPQLKVSASPVMQTPEVLDAAVAGGALTAPSGAKHEAITRGFVAENAGVFGLSAAQVGQLQTSADYANPAGNLSWVELQQIINGIPVFQGTIRAAIRKDGALVRTTGNLAAGLDYASLPVKAKLSPAQAVVAAAAGLGVKITAQDLAKPAVKKTTARKTATKTASTR